MLQDLYIKSDYFQVFIPMPFCPELESCFQFVLFEFMFALLSMIKCHSTMLICIHKSRLVGVMNSISVGGLDIKFCSDFSFVDKI